MCFPATEITLLFLIEAKIKNHKSTLENFKDDVKIIKKFRKMLYCLWETVLGLVNMILPHIRRFYKDFELCSLTV